MTLSSVSACTVLADVHCNILIIYVNKSTLILMEAMASNASLIV